MALLILRTAVALTLILRVKEQWSDITTPFLTGYCFSTVALLLGLLTPIVALLAILVVLFTPTQKLSSENIFDFVVESVVLSLLGPEAYSVDALMYARRSIKFTSSDDTS